MKNSGTIKYAGAAIGGYWKVNNTISFVIYGKRYNEYSELEFYDFLTWTYGAMWELK